MDIKFSNCGRRNYLRNVWYCIYVRFGNFGRRNYLSGRSTSGSNVTVSMLIIKVQIFSALTTISRGWLAGWHLRLGIAVDCARIAERFSGMRRSRTS